MEKISVSALLLLVAISYTLAKDTTAKPGAKKDPKDSRPKLPQTLSRGTNRLFVGSLLQLNKDRPDCWYQMSLLKIFEIFFS